MRASIMAGSAPRRDPARRRGGGHERGQPVRGRPSSSFSRAARRLDAGTADRRRHPHRRGVMGL